MFDSVVSFYNNLFTIEIAVFGIIAAAIFVFLQIVYTQFSYREVKRIFQNKYLIIFVILGIITLFLTASGSLLLSFSNLNPVIGYNFTIKDMFQNWITAASLVVSFFLSLMLFGVFTFSNIKYIRPSRVALLISNNIKDKQIGDYLLKKYGVPAPDDWFFLLNRYRSDSIVFTKTTDKSDEKNELSESERTELDLKKQQFDEEFTRNKKKYEKTKDNIEHAQDPLEPLDALMLRSINNVDLATIREILSVLMKVSTGFLNTYKGNNESKEWNPYSKINKRYLEYLMGLLRIYCVLCDRQKLDPIKIMILETTGNLAYQILDSDVNDTNILLSFWKELADNTIGKSREVFNKVIRLYRDLVDYAFKKGVVDHNDWLDEIFRHLGWLGERLISQRGIEDKPLMRDYHYSNEYDEIFEAIISPRHEYCNKYPMSYPLIYFDVIDVVFLQLVPILKKRQSIGLEENIFDCLYSYSSFAEAAIPIGNSNGAALATLYLRRSYEKLLNEGLEKSTKEAIKLLTRIAGIAFKHKEKLKNVEFMSDSIYEEIKNILQNCPFLDTVSDEIRETYIHLDSDWNFIIEMGKYLHTNFGFMFDWNTGQLYPPDDPRRI